MNFEEKRLLGYKDDEKTAYEIGKEKGLPDPVFNPFRLLIERQKKMLSNK